MKIAITYIITVILFGVSWFANAYKLIQCDFKTPYRGECIHGVGLILLLSPITVWNNEK
jgi:hypothetical protein